MARITAASFGIVFQPFDRSSNSNKSSHIMIQAGCLHGTCLFDRCHNGPRELMIMNFEKYTDRARGFVESAQSLALREGHQQLPPTICSRSCLMTPKGWRPAS